MVARTENPWDHISFIESYYEDGDLEKAMRELERARRSFPSDPTLLEWEAVVASDEGRLLDALDALVKVLALEPQRPFALREKAAILVNLGRFDDALEIYLEIGPERADDRSFYFDVGHCFDRIGDYEKAAEYFEKAARLDPDEFREPVHFSDDEFDEFVDEALASLPEVLAPYVDRALLVFRDYPDALDDNPFRFVRYKRGPMTIAEARDPPSKRTRKRIADSARDRLYIYVRCLEIEFPEPETLIEELTRSIAEQMFSVLGIESDSSAGA